MKWLLAVSGGVDSMVLFDYFLKNYNQKNIVVAHFNHKLRPSADDDEKFIEAKCKEAKIRFEAGHLSVKPGEKISEEKARDERYKFLRSVVEKLQKEKMEPVYITTAHHLDDITETVAINISRGTGWRGLAPLSSNIYRPFTEFDDFKPESRADILTYAAHNKVTFRQDPTNFEDTFLRNRIREKILVMDPQDHFDLNQKIKKLYVRQREIREEVGSLIQDILKEWGYLEDRVAKREWFKDLDDDVASEILAQILTWENISITRPQMKDFLNAIRTYAPEKKFNLPGDRLITIHKNWFKI